MSVIQLPITAQVRELTGPVMIEVITRRNYLNSLTEPDPGATKPQVSSWGERTVFTIDESTGLFQAEGDYGTYAYHWPPAYRGSNIFRFLKSLDFGYFMNKAAKAPYREIDLPRTIKALRAEVIEKRRDAFITRDNARDLWRALGEFDNEVMDEREFFRRWYDDPDLTRFYDGEPVSIYERDTVQARYFWGVIWQALLKSEPFQSRLDTPHERKQA